MPIENTLKHTGENQCDLICQLFNALLPEKDVGLNTHTNHEELRWKVIEDFQNLHSFQNN